jgi:hypothetical protein
VKKPAYKNITVTTCLIILGLNFEAISHAEQWQIVGPRALGMGGAHVAVVNDASASYWNPAAYGFFGRQTETKDEHNDKLWGVHLHAGAGISLYENVAEEVDDVLEYDPDELADKAATGSITQTDLDDLVQLTAKIKDLDKDDIGLIANSDVGLNIRYKHFGIGVISLGEIAATDPSVDTLNLGIYGADAAQAINKLLIDPAATPAGVLTTEQRTQLVGTIAGLTNWSTTTAEVYVNNLDQALLQGGVAAVPDEVIDAAIDVAKVANDLVGDPTSGGNLQDNSSNFLFRGANVIEVPLTYGYALNDNFSLGGNLKFMRARVYHTAVRIFDKEEDGFLEEAYDDYKESNYFGIDLGGLIKYKNLRFGMTGRNLNQPKFDYAGPGDYKLNPQLRAGLAYMPTDWLTLAFDGDVIANKTPLSGHDSQNMGGGVELVLWKFLALRGGAYTNLAENGIIYTAGLGVDMFGFNLDIGAGISDSRTEFDGEKIPEQARAELAVSLQY